MPTNVPPPMPTDGKAIFYRDVQITLRDTPSPQAWRASFQKKNFPDMKTAEREVLRQYGTQVNRGTPDKQATAFHNAILAIDDRLAKMKKE